MFFVVVVVVVVVVVFVCFFVSCFFFFFFFFCFLLLFFFVFVFVSFIAVKTDSKVTVHHGENLYYLTYREKKKKKSAGLHFLNVFNHKEIMGWTSCFPEITETSSAQ